MIKFLVMMAMLGASAYAAQPSDTSTMYDDTAAVPIEHECQCMTDHDCEDTPMKLTELAPKWITADPDRDGIGVTFDCPCAACAAAADQDRQRVAVFFDTPLDGLPQFTSVPKTWHREGATFDDLTLSPSIRFLAHDQRSPGGDLVEHWHGFVRDGIVTS